MNTTEQKQIDDKLKDLEEATSLDSTEIAQTWNTGHEELLASIADRCLGLSWMHTKCKRWFENMNFWLTIPSIIIGTISGSATIGLSSLFSGSTQAAEVTLGVLTLSCGVFSAINNFMKCSVLSESHRITAKYYSKLHRTIQAEIALRRDQRVQAKDFLRIIRAEQDRIEEIAPSVIEEIIKQFKKEFRDNSELEKPEIAGDLEHALINRSIKLQLSENQSTPVKIIQTTPLGKDSYSATSLYSYTIPSSQYQQVKALNPLSIKKTSPTS